MTITFQCSMTCGKGVHTRSVKCMNSSGQEVAHSQCPEGMPRATQNCVSAICNADISEWQFVCVGGGGGRGGDGGGGVVVVVVCVCVCVCVCECLFKLKRRTAKTNSFFFKMTSFGFSPNLSEGYILSLVLICSVAGDACNDANSTRVCAMHNFTMCSKSGFAQDCMKYCDFCSPDGSVGKTAWQQGSPHADCLSMFVFFWSVVLFLSVRLSLPLLVCRSVFLCLSPSLSVGLCLSLSLSVSGLSLSLRYRLVGLVVRRLPRERKISGSNPACAGIFSGSSHTGDLKIGTPVATLPGAWRYRVSTGTGRPGVCIL